VKDYKNLFFFDRQTERLGIREKLKHQQLRSITASPIRSNIIKKKGKTVQKRGD